MNKYEETFQTWNKIAITYQEKFFELDLYNDTYDTFLRYLLPNQTKVLDLGCGPGNIDRYLLDKRPDLEITGLDIAPNMIALDRKNNPEADYEVMDIRFLEELDKNFCGVVSGFALPYLSRKDSIKLFKTCYGLLLEYGIFYFSYLQGNYQNSGYFKGSTGDRVFLYYHDLPFFEDILEKENFQVLHVFQKNYKSDQRPLETHSIVIARKLDNKS